MTRMTVSWIGATCASSSAWLRGPDRVDDKGCCRWKWRVASWTVERNRKKAAGFPSHGPAFWADWFGPHRRSSRKRSGLHPESCAWGRSSAKQRPLATGETSIFRAVETSSDGIPRTCRRPRPRLVLAVQRKSPQNQRPSPQKEMIGRQEVGEIALLHAISRLMRICLGVSPGFSFSMLDQAHPPSTRSAPCRIAFSARQAQFALSEN